MKPVLRILQWVAQALSGAIAYYACEGLSEYFTTREGVYEEVARFFFFLFPLLAVTAFVLLTTAWHKILALKGSTRFPEVFMIVGALVLLPVYFELASHLIYNPTAMHLSEVMEDLYTYYLSFPLTVLDFVSYTFSLHVFVLASVSAVVAGYILRRREGLALSSEN